jgi:hypothetical protein
MNSDPTTTINMTTIIVSIMTIIGSVLLSVVGSFLYIRQAKIDLVNEYEKRFNEKKWKTYLDFTTVIVKFFKIAKTRDNVSLRERYELELDHLVADLLLVGSDSVIIAYRDWRTILYMEGYFEATSLRLLFDVVIEMRKDLGNNKTQVDFDQMLGMLVPHYQRGI